MNLSIRRMNCDTFESEVAEAIARDALLVSDGSPVIVGLSGGADSVALLAVLCRMGYDCRAVHCNFHLRGDEALRDQHHAESVAAQLGASCEVVDFDTRRYMKEHGVSLEMACRELRYDYFRKRMAELDAQAIAVAHHRDDNIETLFLNLLRGTGLRGLRGMLPRQGDVVRPLLGVSRADIERYLAARGLTYVTDSSNAVNDTARNRLRNVVLPALRREFPGADKGMETTLEILRSNERIYTSAIEQASRRYASDGNSRFDLDALASYGTDAPAVLFELLRDRGFNAGQTADMIRSRDHSGRRFVSATHEALIDRGSLLVNPADNSEAAFEVLIDNILDSSLWPVACEVSLISREDFAPERGAADTLYLDAEALDGDPRWVIRSWHDGDRLKPFGMKGARKLSDIFSDAKLSVADKRRVRVLTRNGEIVWVMGIRASRMFPVTDLTSGILKVKIN